MNRLALFCGLFALLVGGEALAQSVQPVLLTDETEDEATLKTWMAKSAVAPTMELFLSEIGLALERRKK